MDVASQTPLSQVLIQKIITSASASCIDIVLFDFFSSDIRASLRCVIFVASCARSALLFFNFSTYNKNLMV